MKIFPTITAYFSSLNPQLSFCLSVLPLRLYRRSAAGAVLALFVLGHLAAPPSRAQAIRGLPGFRANRLPRNDDGSSDAVSIGFTANFFGRTYSSLYVNNNGNVTFTHPLETYVPFGLAHTELPIIAAFFADVDTRNLQSEAVTYGNERVDGHAAFGVNYFRAGYYSNHGDRLNTFQLILIDRSDTGAANFDIEFNYEKILWDLGDAGRGRGDVTAVVGFSNGTGDAGGTFELPGSMQNGALLDNGPKSLIHGMLNSTVPGRYVFRAREGKVSVLRIVTPPQLPEAAAGRAWSVPALVAEGGSAPYSWSALNWPSDLGLHLDTTAGVISGTPSRVGTFSLPVQVSDSAGTTPATQTFILTVAAGLSYVPFVIEPSRAMIDTPVKLVAGLHVGPGARLTAAELPASASITATIEGNSVELHDEGDGRFSATVSFQNSGLIPVELRARLANTEIGGLAHMEVDGLYVYRGGPPELNLGTLREDSESCRALSLVAEQRGKVSLQLRLLRAIPDDHRLELRVAGRILKTGQENLLLAPGDAMEVCLVTGKRAPISDAAGEPWLRLTAGNTTAPQTVDIRLRWHVNGLTFWQRWWWLFGLLLLLLLLLFIVYGYIKPHQFSRGLALTFVPEYDELDQTPQPVSQWRGVRIGFYRDARACLHPSYRVTGSPKGALAILIATADGVSVAPGPGATLSREMDLTEWKEIPPTGNAGRRGAIYRVGDKGPYFRIASRS